MNDARQFACVLCGGKFSTLDIEALRYLMPSQVCRGCYETKAPECFGKFNPTEEACTRLCPDREVCHKWPELVRITPAQSQAVFAVATTKLAETRLAAAQAKGRQRSAAAPFRDGTIIGAFFARAASADGLALAHMREVCAQIESPTKDYYRRLYSGVSGGWKWTARLGDDGANGSVLYITDVKQVVKGKGKR